MKFVLFWMLLLIQPALSTEKHDAHKGHGAHEGHSEHANGLKSVTPPSGTSIFQLESSWKNQNGQDVKISEMSRKNRLVVMLFTRCETACPLIIEDLKKIYTEVNSKKSDQVGVSLFSFDSDRETPASLLEFSAKRKLPSQWELYRSNADAVAELAASLGIRYKRLANGDFIHSNVIYFLNKKGEVVAKKEGLKTPSKEFLAEIKKSL